MREFLVRVLVEVYHEDGGENMRQREIRVDCPDKENGESESFEQLSRKLEPIINEKIPANQCVNYIQDIEYVGRSDG